MKNDIEKQNEELKKILFKVITRDFDTDDMVNAMHCLSHSTPSSELCDVSRAKIKRNLKKMGVL